MQTLYIGTYTNMTWSRGEKGRGLYRTRFDEQTGQIEPLDVTEGLVNPSFGRFNEKRDRLYLINEVQPLDDSCIGRVTSFAVQPDGALERLGDVSSFGLSPCYLAMGPGGSTAYLTNYITGNAVALQIDANGVLAGLRQQVQHSGHSVNPQRQQGPRAHSLCFHPDGGWLCVADLGIDKVMLYRIEQREDGPWMHPAGHASVAPGMGPRHMAFDAAGKRLYVICEMGSQVYLFDFDAHTGTLAERQHLSTLPPEGFAGENNCADLHFGADGRYLYGSNRGHDSLVIYRVCPETGELTLVGHQGTGGRTPRNFTLTADGRWLLVANQDSDSVVSFAVDPKTGLLQQCARFTIPSPVWLGL